MRPQTPQRATLETSARLRGFRGQRVDEEPGGELARRLWDLEALEGRYPGLLAQFGDLADDQEAGREPVEAFALRLALAIRYSAIA